MTMAQDGTPEDVEARLILAAIYERYGYDFRGYAPQTMRQRLKAALTKFGAAHLGDLQHRILNEPVFFGSLLDDLTLPVTEAFRDPAFYLAFRQRVVPLLRTYPHIKLWVAGCASGEEVYSMAILLDEENLYERTQIYGTDISRRALDQAREGVYSEQQLDLFSQNHQRSGGHGHFRDYCTVGYRQVAIREGLRRNVVFFQHDLSTDHALGEMHVVLCRNVLIYFGEALRQRVVAVLTGALCRGGFLCLGASETVSPAFAMILHEFAPRERIYRHGQTT